MDLLENTYDALRLRTPTARFAGTVVGTLIVLYIVKPKMFYREDGEARAWTATSPGDPTATAMPATAAALGLGAISALFI